MSALATETVMVTNMTISIKVTNMRINQPDCFCRPYALDRAKLARDCLHWIIDSFVGTLRQLAWFTSIGIRECCHMRNFKCRN